MSDATSDLMNDPVHQSPDRNEIWKRGLFMILFTVLYGVAELVLSVLVVVQFVVVLVTGAANQQLLRLGGSLAIYSREIFAFLTFNSEQHPFPMNDWPESDSENSPWYEDVSGDSEGL